MKNEFEIMMLVNKDASPQVMQFITSNNFAFTSFPVGNSVSFFFKSLINAFLLVRKNRNALFVIWAHHPDSNRWLQFYLALSRKKYIICERLIPATIEDVKKSRLSRTLKKFATSRSKANVICGYSQKVNYQKYFNVKNILVIPNSRDIKFIRKQVAEYRNLSAWDSDSGTINICIIGRLTEQKDPITILHAVNSLRDRFSIYLTFVGDGELMPVLLQDIAKAEMKNVFFTGFDSTPLQQLAKSDIFILNSLYEGLPGVLIESMAAGVPCIATDIPGNNELVIHEKTGLLVRIKSPSEIADAIVRLATDKGLCDRLTRNAYEHVLNHYDENMEKVLWQELFNRLHVVKTAN